MAKNKQNWLIDGVLFIGFLLTFFLDLTGLAWHQWLGIVVGLITLYHLLIHWKWVLTVTKRFFRRTSKQSRLYYLIDWSLLLSFVLIGISGLVVSSWFNFELDNYLFWKDLHIYSSVVSLLIILVKIGAHWRWIVKTASKYFGLWAHSKVKPAAVPVRSSAANGSLNRREFLQLMGVAGLASLISAANLLEYGQETGQKIITDKLSSPLISDLQPTSASCTIICDKGCVYPGQCRRFIDENENGICDLTECSENINTTSPNADSSSPIQAEETQSEPEPLTYQSAEEECLVLCPRACVYPGECRDYIDTNGNNLCDLGECLIENTTAVATTTHVGRQHRGGK